MYGAELAEIYDAIYVHGKAKDYAGEGVAIAGLIRERKPAGREPAGCGLRHRGHLTHFRAEFPEVAGVELFEPMRRVAAAKLPGVPIHAGDMRMFDLRVGFDVVTCLFSSIGYLRDVGELAAAASRVTGHLHPGGVLVIEPWFTPEQ